MRLKTFAAALLAALLLGAPAAAEPSAAPNGDVATIKQVIQHLGAGQSSKALALINTPKDPAARTLALWLCIRLAPNDVGFQRVADFLRDRPQWPAATLLRRRAERLLWEEHLQPSAVRAFFAHRPPVSGEGKLALARALLAIQERDAAQIFLRDAWRDDDLSKEVEAEAMTTFSGLLSRDDHKARADRFFYLDKVDAGLRAAERAGGDVLTLAKARAAVINKASNAGKLLDTVPASLHSDPGYLFSRIQFLRRKDDIAGAAKLMLSAPRDVRAIVDPDQWWIERRVIARRLLDENDPRTAYRVASESAVPMLERNKTERDFTAGWIAFRFLNDPRRGLQHFAEIPKQSRHPLSLARAFYWLGRAAEAAGDRTGALTHFERAATYPYAYYGQLARSRLGHKDIPFARPPEPSAAERTEFRNQEHVRGLRLLQAAGAGDLVLASFIDLGERVKDARAATLLAELAIELEDPRLLVFLGKGAYARGVSVGAAGFPAFGVPDYTTIGRPVDRAVVYAIARQESAFNPKAVSSADARGLMQMLVSTARAVAKKYGVAFDAKKLAEPAYNAQLGAAELGDLIESYRGSYILSFAAYNAGRSRVADWISRYGDPRDPKVDAVDWVERIPFTETRNYVQRVMENTQVYQARFGRTGLMIDADLARGRIQ